MIREISLTNFLSFKDAKLDLVSRGNNVLKYAMIYGENGSGKTNIIDSVSFLRGEMDTLIIANNKLSIPFEEYDGDDEFRELQSHLNSAFTLIQKSIVDLDPKDKRKNYHSKSIEDNTRLDYIFMVGGNVTEYILEFDKNGRIVFEQMKHRINKGRGTFFKVSWNGTDAEVVLNKDLITDRGYRNELTENIKKFWGNHSLLSILNENRKRMMPEYIQKSVRKELLDVMDYICSLVIVDNDKQTNLGFFRPSFSGIIKASNAAELDSMESILNKFFTRLYSHTVKVEVKRKDDGENIRYKLVFHRKINGKVVEIDANLESAGTKHLISLLYPILAAVTGSTVFIDELDNGIHDNLLLNLVEQVVPNISGQLVCTTHESLLMDVIPPANAFIIQVDCDGNKNIASISSIEKVQKNNSVQKRFLGGRYMGVPIPTMLMLDEIAEDFHKEEVWRKFR